MAGIVRGVWDAVAYLGRYGKQPMSEVLSMTPEDSRQLQEAVSRIVDRENRPAPGSG